MLAFEWFRKNYYWSSNLMFAQAILSATLLVSLLSTFVPKSANAGSFQISEILSSSEKTVIKGKVGIFCVDINQNPGFLVFRNYEARNVRTKELTTGTDFLCRAKKPNETIDWKTLTELQRRYSHPSN